MLQHITRLEQLIKSRIATHGLEDQSVQALQNESKKYNRINVSSISDPNPLWQSNKSSLVYSYFQAKRNSEVVKVEAPSKETEFIEKLNAPDSADFFVRKFKQYLVNQKVDQAFSQIEGQSAQIERVNLFFAKLEEAFRKLFDDNLMHIEFVRSHYEFYLTLQDGRQLTFDTLSEGFSALLSIFMDLFTRVDLIRKQVKNFSYDPCGIVLIDEPETHLHLKLQELILPLLTEFFPNIQLIVATHSFAVIASIKNVTVFDVATKDVRNDEVVGQSYSELMTGHFGLENDYSNEADKILKQINQAVAKFNNDPEKLREALRKIRAENANYISPTIEVELEVLLAKSNAKYLAHR